MHGPKTTQDSPPHLHAMSTIMATFVLLQLHVVLNYDEVATVEMQKHSPTIRFVQGTAPPLQAADHLRVCLQRCHINMSVSDRSVLQASQGCFRSYATTRGELEMRQTATARTR